MPMTFRKTTKNPEMLPNNDLGIDKIRKDIVTLKKDAEALETKRVDFEKNKKILTKEKGDKLKQEIDTEINRIETKKQELLTLIKQTKWELEVLKWSVEIATEKNELEQLEKEINEIQGQKKNVFEKSWSRVKENPGKTVLFATWVGFLVRGISRLFKKDEDNSWDEEEKTKKKKKHKKSRRKRVLLWAGIGTGWVLIRKNWETIKSRFTGKKETEEKFHKKFKTEEKQKVEEFKKEVQKTIEETNASKYDFKDQRGDIKFDISKEPNYKIQSRGQETAIGFDVKQSKYKIADLDIWFTDLKELIRAANLTNRFLRKYRWKKTFWNSWWLTNNFIYREDLIQWDWIYYSWYIKNTLRLVKKTTMEKYCKWWKKNQMESYVDYLNKIT